MAVSALAVGAVVVVSGAAGTGVIAVVLPVVVVVSAAAAVKTAMLPARMRALRRLMVLFVFMCVFWFVVCLDRYVGTCVTTPPTTTARTNLPSGR